MGSSTPPDRNQRDGAPLHALFKQILLTAGTIRDVKMRAEALLGHMRAAQVGEVARALDQLCFENERGEPRAMLAMQVVVTALTEPSNEAWAKTILRAAQMTSLAWTSRLLAGFDTTPHVESTAWRATIEKAIRSVEGELSPEGATATNLDDPALDDSASASLQGDPEVAAFLQSLGLADVREEPKEANVPNYGTSRPLSLGERKSLARRPTRAQIARLLRDPNPAVTRILLQNPMVTEDDVLRIAAMRPGSAEVLREVAQHRRWMSQARILRALVLNPATPAEIAVSRVFLLPRQDLSLVATTLGTPATVRTVAEAVLAARRR